MLVMGPLPRREVEKWKTNNHEIISGESGKGAGERREPERKKKDGCLSSPSPPPPSPEPLRPQAHAIQSLIICAIN